jgi:DeoR family transcriptional regulator, fructose operon transcriptional repressor
MNSKPRQEEILLFIDQKKHVTINELVKMFSVNAMTIRRDLIALENQGLIRRYHGGAGSSHGRSYEQPFMIRSDEHKNEKEQIGKTAAVLIKDGDSIAIDVGTTALEVARNLKGKLDLTIITNSLRVVNLAIESCPKNRIILPGGIVNISEPSLTGDLTVSSFENFFVDKLFLGVGGIDFDEGLTDFNFEDAQIKKTLIKKAKEIILVADSSKFNRIAFAYIAPISKVNRIVTDDSIDRRWVKKIKEIGIELILAGNIAKKEF